MTAKQQSTESGGGLRTVTLTARGIQKAEQAFQIENPVFLPSHFHEVPQQRN